MGYVRSAAIGVKKGFLGMPWVSGIYPVLLVPTTSGDHAAHSRIMKKQNPVTKQVEEISAEPMIVLDDDKLMEPSDQLRKNALACL